MRVSIFNAAVSAYDRCGRLLADGRDAGNIVRGIPHQSFHVDELCGRHLVLPFHILRVIVVDLRAAPAGLGDADFDVLVRQLQQVPVTGDNGHLDALLLAALGHGAQNVVRLITRHRQNRHAHGCKHLLHQRHLLVELLGHGLARALVGFVHLMAEGGLLQVKGHRQVVRFLLLENFKHDI